MSPVFRSLHPDVSYFLASRYTLQMSCLLFNKFIAATGFCKSWTKKTILQQLFVKRFDGFDESEEIKNFIRLKDGLRYKIFQNPPAMFLKLFVTSGCYWSSTDFQ